MTKLFYLETFGCQMNVVDSEWISTLLKGEGYAPIDDPEQADLIILNTCSVRDKAERKVYGHLGSYKPLKDKNPQLILAVGGCVAQQEGTKLLEQLPYLNIVFGTHNVDKLPQMVKDVVANGGQLCEIEHYVGAERLGQFPQRDKVTSVSRFVTIVQGCDNFCSYCVVPYVRGREVSRNSDDVVAEVRTLVDQGVREVTLLGQNVNSYGQKGSGDVSFAELLHRVHDIEGLQRLRFTSSHPKDLSDDLITCFSTLDKLCKHMHLAVQSGSNRVLKQMNRGYSREQYLERVQRLQQQCPTIRMTTDIIVGFPGETETEFWETLELLERVRFADAYSFLYSPRPQTKAREFADPISAIEKQHWFEELLAVQERISAEVWQEDLLQIQPVLVEGMSKRGSGQMFGRNQWNRIVNFNGPAALVGQTVDVRIDKVLRNSHLAALV
jgi:tRNA-2-methylthio-N6-dimethylallyladenosine synthase